MTSIERISPLSSELALLMERHTAQMHADTPAESIHMLDAGALAEPGVSFYVMRDGGTAVAMGAFKRLGPDHAELKSMHVLAEHRGRKLSAVLLAHLVAEARAMGIERLSLETGSQDSFAAARGLYLRAGFEICGPFGDYRLDPHSTYMTRAI